MIGLYRFYTDYDALLYVGITGNVPVRLNQHAAEKPWMIYTARIMVQWFEDRQDAMRAETIAIIRERPEYNDTYTDAQLVYSALEFHEREGRHESSVGWLTECFGGSPASARDWLRQLHESGAAEITATRDGVFCWSLS